MNTITKPRIIYVEGLAGAGKTSFIEQAQKDCGQYAVLQEYTSEESQHTKKKLDTFMKHTEEKMYQLRDYSGDKHVLVDRGPLSMLVNAFVETQEGINTSYEAAMDWYRNAKANGLLVVPDLYIYITAPHALIESRAKKGGWHRHDLGWLANPALAMSHYEQLFAELEPDVPILRLDGSKDSAVLVQEFLDQEQQAGHCKR